jgi:hypothetical protein
MNLRVLNKILSISIILLNLYFLPLTIKQIYFGGGPMGYGLLIIPFTITINLFLISAFYSLKKTNEKNIRLIVINLIGLVLGITLFTFFIKA